MMKVQSLLRVPKEKTFFRRFGFHHLDTLATKICLEVKKEHAKSPEDYEAFIELDVQEIDSLIEVLKKAKIHIESAMERPNLMLV